MERPKFFEGQYIGADDLDTIIAYTRARHDQHLLAGHGWGIAAGLELVERSSSAGGVEVWLQPGYAWDGYGRSILVDTPVPLGTAALQGKPTGAWFVWLAYSETPRDAARASYGVCEGADQFLRVGEDYQLVVSGHLRLDQQQGGVVVAGTLRPDARLARRLFDPNGPFLCDSNVPEQGDHPQGGKAPWLIPVGLVGWDGAKQQIVALSGDEKRGARLFRRSIGTIAEDIWAPGGLLRLRRHGLWAPPGTPDSELATRCIAAQPVISDLVQTPDGRVDFDDLVWIEGNLRVIGDARLYAGQLQLRGNAGTEPGGPLFLRRKPGAGTAQDLEIAIGNGPAGPGSVNRLVVGPIKAPPPSPAEIQPVFAVQADGRVGIGTATPANGLALDIKGDFGHDGDPVTIHLMGSRIGDAGDGVLGLTSGGGIINLGGDNASGNRVGIRTRAPAADLVLDVHGPIGITANPAFLRLLGSELRDQADGILRIRSGGGSVVFDGNDLVGIGTAAPTLPLDVSGDARITGALGANVLNASSNVNAGGNVNASTNVNAGTNVNAAANVNAGGNLNASGNVNAGRDHSVGRNAAIAGNLVVNGNATVNGSFSAPSDVRLKQAVRPIEHPLQLLLKLRGVAFEWAREDLARVRPGPQMGLIADDVERVLPNWVRTDEQGVKLVSTQGFEALAIEALRELSTRLDHLAAENRALKHHLAKLSPGSRPSQPRKPTGRASS
jgi:hypothetical protein